jgi:hypothetical protein
VSVKKFETNKFMIVFEDIVDFFFLTWRRCRKWQRHILLNCVLSNGNKFMIVFEDFVDFFSNLEVMSQMAKTYFVKLCFIIGYFGMV